MNRPLLLGHRGARKYAPENTIAAFEACLADGCDGFEFDVRLTADRQAVVCHDPKFCGVTIARSTSEKLFAAVSKKRKEISVLEEVLRFGSRAFLNVELKVSGAEESLIELLQKYSAARGVIVSSFLPAVIERCHELGAEVPLGLICESQRQLAKWKELPIQALMLHHGLVTAKLMGEIRTTPLKPKEGLNGAPSAPEVFVWTVNTAREMKKFAEMGVDGIISDETKLLVKTLRPDLSSGHS